MTNISIKPSLNLNKMICTSIASVSFEETKSLIQEATMAEIRLDLLDFSMEEIETIFSNSKIPLIATYRPGKISEKERLGILKKTIEFGAKYIDVEIESLPDFKKEIVRAAKGKCEVIISYHNYEITPVRYELEVIVQQCFDQGADIAKLACQVNSKKEAARILGLYSHFEGLVAIGMGELGKITRVASVVLGAPFTFASIDTKNSTAPGQLTSDSLSQIYGVLN